MKQIYIYPGTFSPPTFGHLYVVEQVACIVPALYIICSKNDQKDSNWFSPDIAKRMWQTYRLPDNVIVETLEEFLSHKFETRNIIMVRGIRDESDYLAEQQVAQFNNERFGIQKFFYVYCDKEFSHISSSAVRTHTKNLALYELNKYVSPLVISSLLEHKLQVKNIFMVVGKPGSGKSTILNALSQKYQEYCVINTDDFNHLLRPLLQNEFGDINFFDAVVKNERRVIEIVGDVWMRLLVKKLMGVPQGTKNVFVEIPYGLQPEKRMYRFVGGKIIYVGCSDVENIKRINERGTPQLSVFINSIPGREETQKIIEANKLSGYFIDTSGEESELCKKVDQLHQYIKEDLW